MKTLSNWHKSIAIILSASLLGGCVSMITDRFANNLSAAILNQDDPETVRDGAPAYLLLLDSLVLDAPDNPDVLRASATLYGTYATIFVSDTERSQRLATKAYQQARTAICSEHKALCANERGNPDAFREQLAALRIGDIDLLYTWGTSWAGWIQTHRNDWNAIADLPRVEQVMKRVIELDETHDWGRAHVYLGVINSQLPPSLGGKPDIGRAHFEQAINISNGRDLIAHVEFARTYARLVFDQELHDRLLNDVLTMDERVNSLILSNALAKREADKLLQTSAAYFED